MQTSQCCVNRFATSLFKLLHFSIMSVVGYAIMQDEPWFPRALGGSGDLSKFLEAEASPPSPALRYYVLVELAYQTHSLLFVLFCKPWDSDTMDFVAHDLMGMLLIGDTYVVNYFFVAAPIAFLNDVCDIVQYALFMATDSRRKAIIAPAYVAFLVGWWYTRLDVFPRYLYFMCVVLPIEDPFIALLNLQQLNIMLTLLLGLQSYWYAVLVIKGYRMLTATSSDSWVTKRSS